MTSARDDSQWDAFMSYNRFNNDANDGYLSRFRRKLELMVSERLGRTYRIFQDSADIVTGDEFEERLRTVLSKSTILIPILTPHFLNSDWCRREFDYFWQKEQRTGKSPTVVPIHFVECEQMKDLSRFTIDSVERRIAAYQWAEWHKIRFRPLSDAAVKSQMDNLAGHIHLLHKRALGMAGATPLSATRSAAFNAVDEVASFMYGVPCDLDELRHARPFFGRGAEIQRIVNRLTQGHGHRVVSITGNSGIGKTVLASEAAQRMCGDACFPAGIAVANCEDLDSPEEVLQRVLTRFHPRHLAPIRFRLGELADEASRVLRGKRALVILDDVGNVRNLAAATDPLRDAGLALLLTSKEPLSGVQCHHISLESLPPQHARELLMDPTERSL